MYSFFTDYIKSADDILLSSSNGEPAEIMYCYFISDLKNSEWYAVALRNLDFNCSKEKIKDFCSIITPGVLYVLQPKIIFESLCTIVVTQELDDAEKICVYINTREIKDIFSGRRLKVK
jgi:hypothetical protein